jgi:RHH-type transcriptional regulator, rel operon repressor / antitoxin RelB
VGYVPEQGVDNFLLKLYIVIQNGGQMMFAIRLNKEIEKELNLLAKIRGTNRSEVVREAILQYLEDNEDLEMAKKAISSMQSSKSLKQLRKDLGLDS